MLAADAELDVRAGGASQFASHLDQFADAVLIKRDERIVGEDVVVDIERQELAGIVTRHTEGRLGQVVGAEREEFGFDRYFVSRQGGARQFDHRADQVLDLDAVTGYCFITDRHGVLLENRQLLGGRYQRNHDLRNYAETLVFHQLADRFHDGCNLHVVDFRVGDSQAAAAVTQHRVEFVQRFDLVLEGVDRHLHRLRQLDDILFLLRQELVQRRIEQPDGHRQPLHLAEEPDKVPFLHRQDLVQGQLAPLDIFGQDHLPHGGDPLGVEEHMFGAAEPDSLGAELSGHLGIIRRIGVGPYL